METIVLYNSGKDARTNGAARIAPNEIDYPIVSRYEVYRVERVKLSEHDKRHWLDGFDGKYERRRARTA